MIEQTEARGHAVRLTYMFSAVADLAYETGEESLRKACQTMWENVTQKQMYITGGVGSSDFGEAFSFNYDLPNDTCYAETCAAIGLVFWAWRMLKLEANGSYTDVMERALYNGVISSMDLDGKKFFYVNPLEVWPQASKKRKDKQHILPVRQKWYGCACCPPNLARLVASLGHYIYSEKGNCGYVHLFVDSETVLNIAGQYVQMTQETHYPWDEKIDFTVCPEKEMPFTIALRVPGWCRNPLIKVNDEEIHVKAILKNGYAYIHRLWKRGDRIRYFLPMPIERVRSHPKVRANIGKVALQKGPIVYCLEETDNGANLPSIRLSKESRLKPVYRKDILGGIQVITGQAERADESAWGVDLYRSENISWQPTEITAVPYLAWCNRDPGEMLIWINEKE